MVWENTRQSITCGTGRSIEILAANYGRTSTIISGEICRAEISLSIVERTCNGKERCELFASNSVFGDPCPGPYKWLEVQYKCHVAAKENVTEGKYFMYFESNNTHCIYFRKTFVIRYTSAL